MGQQSLWDRLRQARVFQIVVIYLGASWAVLEVAELFQQSLELPAWLVPVAIVLLTIGLLIILATAWVQSLPATRSAVEAGDEPGAWEVAPGGILQAIRDGELPHLTWGRSILGGVFALALLFGFAGLYVLIEDRGRSFVPAEAQADEAGVGIAVVPFTTRGEELDLWQEGMVDLFTMSLDGVGGYRTIDSRTVLARWRDLAPDNGSPDLSTVREIARRAGARYVMTGSVVALGDEVQIQAELVDVESGRDVGAGRLQGPPDSIPHLVDDLSIRVLEALLRERDSEVLAAHRAASRTTASLPALKAYLEGEAHFRHADFVSAGEAYDRALEADSTFALAHLRLSQVYGWTESLSSERGLEHTLAAERLAEKLGSRDRAIVEGYAALRRGDLSAIESVEATAAKYPDDPEAQFLLGEYYVHRGTNLLVNMDETSTVLRNTLALDPNFGPYYVHALEYAIADGDTTWTRQLVDDYGRVSGGDATAHLQRTLPVDLLLGDSAAQASARAALDTVPDRGIRSILWALWLITERPAAFLPVVEEAQDRGLAPPWVMDWLLFGAGKFDERAEHQASQMRDWPPAFQAWDSYRLAGGPEPKEVEPVTYRDCESHPAAGARLQCALLAADWSLTSGDTAEGAEIVAEFREVAEGYLAAGDSASAERNLRAADAVEAYALHVTEDAATAIAALEPMTRKRADAADTFIRFWLAELNRASGRLSEAVPYYESMRRDGSVAFASYRLGEIYTELGQPEDAIEAYSTFLQAWEEADEDLPRLEEARTSLENLLAGQG